MCAWAHFSVILVNILRSLPPLSHSILKQGKESCPFLIPDLQVAFHSTLRGLCFCCLFFFNYNPQSSFHCTVHYLSSRKGAVRYNNRGFTNCRFKDFEMLCWRRIEKISWTDRLKNEEVLLKSQGAEEYPT